MESLLPFWIFCIFIRICVCSDTDVFLHQLDICQETIYSCEKETKNVFCSCDQICIYYDNCCFDAAVIKDKNIGVKDQRQKYLEMTTCETIGYREATYFTQGAFMISYCPVSWDSDMDTRQACELNMDTDVRDVLPVVHASTNLTFKNCHCAKCHGVINYVTWSLELECLAERLPPSLSITEEVMTKLQSDRCSYRFIPPNDVIVHYCYQEFNYTMLSNISESDNNSACQNRVFSPVFISQGKHSRYYRTLRCLIANEGPMYRELLYATICNFILSSENEHTLKATLGSLIDFSSVFRGKVKKCKDKEIQLFDEDDCHRLYCPAHSEPAGGECVDIKHTSDGFILDLLFEANTDFKTDRTLRLSFIPILNTLMTDFGNYIGSLLWFNYIHLSRENTIPGLLLNSEEQCSMICIYLNIKGRALTGDTLESERHWIASYFNNYTVRNTDDSFIRHIADVRDILCKTNVSVRNPLYIREMISVDNDLPCPAVKLQYSGNGSDSEGEKNNLSLSNFYLRGIRISPLDVAFANGDHFVCIDTLLSKYQLNYQQYDIMDSYRRYINTACASISIICMVYCLIQYCAIPIFRDGKSDMLIVLILFLLLTQTCFFIFSHFEIPSYVCEWVGLVHHFTWLCAFVFMFLCPYRLNTEIRDLQTYSRSGRRMATVKYMLVGISLPLVVIIGIKTANLLLAPTEKLYGGRLCFISQTFVMLFGFVVPVFVILCGNVVLLIFIIHYMTSTSIAANSSRSNVMVFIKISTVMGFSWIIGIVAILSQSDVLLLVFEVLSNLQGTFITISFSCSSRVKTFYKGCFQQMKRKSSAEHATPCTN